MKQLKEYKAEIFRRSEEIILERTENKKRRKKILMSLCVPLCLAVVISSVMILPSLIQGDHVSNEEDKIISDADGAAPVDTHARSYLYADISFCDEDKQNRIDAPEKLNELSELIRCAYADSYLYYDITERGKGAEDDEGDFVDNEMYDAVDESVSENEVERYTITLTAPDGYQKKIIIEGNTISDPELDIEATLKEKRLEQLKELLISVY